MKDDSVTKLLAELDGHVDALPAGINVKSITSGAIDARQASAFIGLANGYQELRYAVRDCPLRQLAKWVGGMGTKNRDAWFTVWVSGDLVRVTAMTEKRFQVGPDLEVFLQVIAPTILEAAADAVRQLRERGEL